MSVVHGIASDIEVQAVKIKGQSRSVLTAGEERLAGICLDLIQILPCLSFQLVLLSHCGNDSRQEEFRIGEGIETMNRSKASREEGLTEEIRRQFGDRPTARFLRSMPMFRVVSDIPDHMRDLLDRLDGVGEDSGTKAR